MCIGMHGIWYMCMDMCVHEYDVCIVCMYIYAHVCVHMCVYMCVKHVYMYVYVCVCVLFTMAARSIIYTSHYVDSPLTEEFICEKAIRLSLAQPPTIKIHNEQH